MTTESFVVQVDPKTVKQLDLLAESLHLSRNTLMNYAIEQFLESNELQIYRAQRNMRLDEDYPLASLMD